MLKKSTKLKILCKNIINMLVIFYIFVHLPSVIFCNNVIASIVNVANTTMPIKVHYHTTSSLPLSAAPTSSSFSSYLKTTSIEVHNNDDTSIASNVENDLKKTYNNKNINNMKKIFASVKKPHIYINNNNNDVDGIVAMPIIQSLIRENATLSIEAFLQGPTTTKSINNIQYVVDSMSTTMNQRLPTFLHARTKNEDEIKIDKQNLKNKTEETTKNVSKDDVYIQQRAEHSGHTIWLKNRSQQKCMQQYQRICNQIKPQQQQISIGEIKLKLKKFTLKIIQQQEQQMPIYNNNNKLKQYADNYSNKNKQYKNKNNSRNKRQLYSHLNINNQCACKNQDEKEEEDNSIKLEILHLQQLLIAKLAQYKEINRVTYFTCQAKTIQYERLNKFKKKSDNNKNIEKFQQNQKRILQYNNDDDDDDDDDDDVYSNNNNKNSITINKSMSAAGQTIAATTTTKTIGITMDNEKASVMMMIKDGMYALQKQQ